MDELSSVEVYVGAELLKDEFINLFGPKYEDRVHDKCPKDETPNTDNNNFCGKCGNDLRYKEKVKEGLESFSEAKDFFKSKGLDAIFATKEPFCDRFIIGEEVGRNYSGGRRRRYNMFLMKNSEFKDKAIEKVSKKLRELGIDKEIGVYVNIH